MGDIFGEYLNTHQRVIEQNGGIFEISQGVING